MADLPPLDDVLRSLHQERLTFFPIRHHSPACAWHIQQWILTEKPTAILIEAPADATELIPLLLHPETQSPVAIYTTYIDHAGHLNSPTPRSAERKSKPSSAERQSKPDPLRFAGYYPFCDYSPELVALQAGSQVGATLQFIDLPYPQKVMAAHGSPEAATRFRALQEEHYLQHSAYLNALAKKTGCRDFNELWDHLFEARAQHISTAEFIQQMATYCYFSRKDVAAESLEADGTVAREAMMAGAIANTLRSTDGKILVVTGGFHTIILPTLVQSPPEPAPAPKLAPTSAQTVMMRYSFEQLDALNGYASGMPTPAYYQQLWQHMQAWQADRPKELESSHHESEEHNSPLYQTACDLLITIRGLTRQRNALIPLSVADEIAAVAQAQRLAQFRQHSGPTREDMLDAVRSCFVKGAMDGEGAMLMAVVTQALQGSKVGALPRHAKVPPLVEDFRTQAQHFRLKLNESTVKSLTLDIYRKERHRHISRFLHILRVAQVPFARFVNGPDFVRGRKLNQIQEHWDYRWIPQTESTLIEQSLYGPTLTELALYHLLQQIAALADAGDSRSAAAAVTLLISACRMGLQSHTDQVLDLIAEHIATDPSVVSLAQAIGQLQLLWRSREPLEAQHLDTVPHLAIVAYQRLCYLIPQLADCSLDDTAPILNALNSVWEILCAQSDLDQDLFIDGLLNLLATPGNPIILGGAVGILYSAERMGAGELVTLAAGHLDHAAAEPAQGIGFLRGLLKTCREVSWHIPDLIEAINARLEHWDEDEFLKVLPELRLAFADLIPRETDKVAALAAGLHGKTDLGSLVHMGVSEAELHQGLALEQRVRQALVQDGLVGWVK